MLIAVDFDGTCVHHEFPEVGGDVPGAVEVLRDLPRRGHRLVLFTMRSGKFLEHAIRWFEMNEIELEGIQYAPGQTEWTSSNKCYANLYIDDASLGAPLIYPKRGRPYINWKVVDTEIRRLAVEPEQNPVIGGGLSDQ